MLSKGFSYLWLLIIVVIFMGGVSFSPVLVMMAMIMFSLSFSTWAVSFMLFNYVVINMVGASIATLLLMMVTEVLVIALRPVTLTLRVFINIMIGHEVSHLVSNNMTMTIFMVFEAFVYLVQSYVFLVLSTSYIEDNV